MSTTRDRRVPVCGKAKTNRIDLGLAILSAIALPDVRYTLAEIAAFCGCSSNAIYLIEQRALRKLKRRMQWETDLALKELVEQVTRR